jgi:hypothetical protein
VVGRGKEANARLKRSELNPRPGGKPLRALPYSHYTFPQEKESFESDTSYEGNEYAFSRRLMPSAPINILL